MPKKKIRANNQIRASKVRVIGQDGKQIGIFPIKEALKKAKEKGLDLVQITDKATPPVCKITEYGKYLYNIQKKEKTQKGSETKGIRLRFNISDHDMDVRIKKAVKFLKEGNKIKVDMVLRGRERRLSDFAKDKVNQFLEKLSNEVPIKKEGKLSKSHRGFSIIVVKSN